MKKRNLMILFIALAIFNSCGGGSEISNVDLFPVKSGDNFQYIDRDGKIIINPQFSEATVFRNDVALVKSSGDNPKWGFIDKEGKYIVNANYKSATVFSEGLAWVVEENGAPYAISDKGEIIITLPDVQSVKIFKNGLAAYSTIISDEKQMEKFDIDEKVDIDDLDDFMKELNDEPTPKSPIFRNHIRMP